VKDKYKISPQAIKAADLDKPLDKDEERFKQDKKDYPELELNNQELTEKNLSDMIDLLSDDNPKKAEYKKKLEEMKQMAKTEPSKDVNKKESTATNDHDEIEEKHPKVTDGQPEDKPKDMMTMDFPKASMKARIDAGIEMDINETLNVAQEIVDDLNVQATQEEIAEFVEIKNAILQAALEEPINKKEIRNKIKALDTWWNNLVERPTAAEDGEFGLVIENLNSLNMEAKIKASKLTEEKNTDDVAKKVQTIVVEAINDEAADFNPELDEDVEWMNNMLNTLISSLKELFRVEAKIKADELTDQLEQPAIIQEPTPEEPVIEDEGLGEDIFDISEGLAIGNGIMVHKDDETGELYAIDKEGNEIVRTVNAFVNDMAKVIEFYRDLLGIDNEETQEVPEEIEEIADEVIEEAPVSSAATDDSEKDTIDDEEKDKDKELVIDEEGNIEEGDLPEEPKEEQPDETELSDKIQELIDVQKEQTDIMKEEEVEEEEEALPDMSEDQLIDLKRQIDEKKDKVASTIEYMIENNKITPSNADINACRVKGESIIFAKQRARQKKVKELTKKLMKADDEMIDLYVQSLENNNTKEEANIFSKLFKN